MDVEQYRRDYEARLAAAEADTAADSRLFSLRTALPGAPVVDATTQARGPDLGAQLTILRNAEAPAAARMNALDELQIARFSSEGFDAHRAEFLQTLRDIARPETPAELRESALATLSAENDASAEEKLRAGLFDDKLALVSPLRALQILSLNDHADVAPLAEIVFRDTDDLSTKEAALRVLSTDPKSQDLLQDVLTDKDQARSLRALSATGLNVLNPARFADVAKTLVTDTSDFEDIRASALGALANTAHEPLREDKSFVDEIRTLGAQNELGNLNAAANRFLQR
ncbi:hypothetical protein RPB_2166 [Rhodopseudomonas palustris HaA2]|uniref:HEAT repeat domain-containing protein n=1 Tax=Rhodopseudomonas palustris (strain HaA2) TaxID=316058 RepID=Q2IY38_RHOP2|nr:hypothetical protein [Rhodopseudomonas palustris]ABD06872.1 hypothetical protein RPB_2166 [Rhodopseudomonas palustris HaA2]